MALLCQGGVTVYIYGKIRANNLCTILRRQDFSTIVVNQQLQVGTRACVFPLFNRTNCLIRYKSTISKNISLKRKSVLPRDNFSTSDDKGKLNSNSKRFERSKKRFPDHINQYNIKKNLSKSFLTQRENISDLFSQESNIADLFKDSRAENKTKTRSVGTYEVMKRNLNNGKNLLYYRSEIQNSLMLLATYFINSILVEINVRKTFHDQAIKKYSSSTLFRESLFDNIKSKDKKNEMYKILVGLYDLEESGVPNCLDQFMAKLHLESVDKLINIDLKRSDEFNSLEFLRYTFTHIKTTQYLNYDHSDTLKFIKSECPVAFNSMEINNEEFLEKFNMCFNSYNPEEPLGHLELLVSLVRVILSSQKYTPNYSIFIHLLEKFENCNLLNYQSLVYDSLPSIDDSRLILANPAEGYQKQGRMSHQFQELIEKNPNFLVSLLRYQVPRGDLFTLQELLTFFNLKQVQDHAKLLKKTNLLSLVSQSRFKNKEIRLAFVEFKSDEPILVLVDSIYTAIDCCIKLKQYEYIDLLLTKLILNLCEKDSQLKVVLSFGNNENSALDCRDSLLISKGLSLTTIESKIFTKDIFKLLLKTCVESDDVGRLLWLLPHLDNYLATNIESSKTHIESIAEFLNKSMLNEEPISEDEYRNFVDANKRSKIDMDLISNIYQALKVLRLDGRILTYDAMLHFANTDSNQIKLKKNNLSDERINFNERKYSSEGPARDLFFNMNSSTKA